MMLHRIAALFSNIFLLLLMCDSFNFADGETLKQVVVIEAGRNVFLPCPGLTNSSGAGGYIVNHLLWQCAPRHQCPAANSRGHLVEYSNNQVRVLGKSERVRFVSSNWSLALIQPRGVDSAQYTCLLNQQKNLRRTVQLIVLDVPGSPSKPVVTKYTSREVHLSWPPSFPVNHSPIKYYVVQTRQGEDGPWPSNTSGLRTAGVVTNTSVPQLTPFTVYTFRLLAVNEVGASRPSPPSYPVSTLREKPSMAPVFTMALNRSMYSVELAWRQPPASSIHGEFLGYKLSYTATSQQQKQSRGHRWRAPVYDVNIRDTSVTKYTISELEPFTEYEVSLRVRNPEDLGPLASVKVRTSEGVPTRPLNLSLTNVDDSSISLSWQRPLQINGLIQGYSIYASTESKTTRKLLVQGDHKHFITITKLAADKHYRVWVRAITGAGEGESSPALPVTTDVTGPGPPVITNVTCVNPSALRLQWQTPQSYHRSVDKYFVLYRVTSQPSYTQRMIPVANARNNYAINLPNLTTGQVYELRIQGATQSRLVSGKIYKGHRSAPAKVRMVKGCRLEELSSTWKYRSHLSLNTAQLIVVSIVFSVIVLMIFTVIAWRRFRGDGGAVCRFTRSPSLLLKPGGWQPSQHTASSHNRRTSKPTLQRRAGTTVDTGWTADSQEAVGASSFALHVQRLHDDNDDGFRRQWERLQAVAVTGSDAVHPSTSTNVSQQQQQQQHQQTTLQRSGHNSKLCCSDQLRRVVVSDRAEEQAEAHSTLPSAYFVDGFRQRSAFIVCERPAVSEHQLLWAMVWQQHVRIMVLVGGATGSMERFWPDTGSVRRVSASLMVECVHQSVLRCCVVRTFNLYNTQRRQWWRRRARQNQRQVVLLQYSAWPDYGLPECRPSLLQFLARTLVASTSASVCGGVSGGGKQATPPASGRHSNHHPLLVVSGNTYNSNSGIFVCLFSLLQQLQHCSQIGVFSFWQHVIGQCPYFLTTVQEYSFIHDCLLERVMSGNIEVTLDQAPNYVQLLQHPLEANLLASTGAEQQYKQAISMESHCCTVISAAKACNKAKNRSFTCIPMEISRVLLTCRTSVEGGDYINASWLPGFYHSREFILTQHPLPNTVLDFWRMLWQHRATTVACLTAQDCGIFWPLDEEQFDGDGFCVRYLSASAGCSDSYKVSWTIRSFVIEATQGDNDITVRVVFLPMWPEECSIDSVMDSVVGVHDIHPDRHTPLVVMDRYASTEGASFCVLSCVLRQLLFERKFDVYTTAKLYHQNRPGIWKTMREYMFLYQAVVAWLPSVGQLNRLNQLSSTRRHSCTSLCQSMPRDATCHVASRASCDSGSAGVMV